MIDLSRRQFITRSALVLAAPAIVPYANLMPMSRRALYPNSVTFTVSVLDVEPFRDSVSLLRSDGSMFKVVSSTFVEATRELVMDVELEPMDLGSTVDVRIRSKKLPQFKPFDIRDDFVAK